MITSLAYCTIFPICVRGGWSHPLACISLAAVKSPIPGRETGAKVFVSCHLPVSPLAKSRIALSPGAYISSAEHGALIIDRTQRLYAVSTSIRTIDPSHHTVSPVFHVSFRQLSPASSILLFSCITSLLPTYTSCMSAHLCPCSSVLLRCPIYSTTATMRHFRDPSSASQPPHGKHALPHPGLLPKGGAELNAAAPSALLWIVSCNSAPAPTMHSSPIVIKPPSTCPSPGRRRSSSVPYGKTPLFQGRPLTIFRRR